MTDDNQNAHRFNSEIAIPTLRQLVKILELHDIEYRFLGSVVTAAINKGLHRNLGDLDLIVDSDKSNLLFNELKRLGYYQARGMFSFARKYLALETLDNDQLLGVGYFNGKWLDNGSFMMGNKRVNVVIEALAVQKTKYELSGISFFGIPERAIATGVNASKSNPKRRRELELLKSNGIEALSNTYIHITVFGIRADWLYHLSMWVLNIIGVMRVWLGMAFDPWR